MDCSRLCRYQHTPTHSVVELDVDSPLRSITGVLNYHDLGGRHTLQPPGETRRARRATRRLSPRHSLIALDPHSLRGARRATDRRSHSSVFASTSVRATAVSPSSDPMADDGAPRGTPPPRPSSRSGSDHSTPPRDDPDPAASASADADGEAERRHLRRATTLDAHRDPHGPRDDEMDHLRRVLADYREENDSLGEAVLAMKSALLRASEEAERAASEKSAAALASARDALSASRADASDSARRSKRRNSSRSNSPTTSKR